MAEHDHIRLLSRDASPQGFRGVMHIHDVMDEKLAAAEFDDLGFLVMKPRIVVAEHGRDWCDGFQFENHPREADVAAVQDVFYSGEDVRDSGIKIVVGV